MTPTQLRQDIYAEFKPQPTGWNLYIAPEHIGCRTRHNKRPSRPHQFTAEELFLINLKRQCLTTKKGAPNYET